MHGRKAIRRSIAIVLLLGPMAPRVQPQVSDPMKRSVAKGYPTQYESRRIEGWTVLVNRDFLRQRPNISERTLTLLQFQLYQIVRIVPATAVAKLRRVKIWVEENEPNTPCMAYHPDAGWLKEHGVNPAKQGCVELSNARNFLKWTLEQPWMVLHELSHAYHHRFLRDGFENAQLKGAYARIMKSRIYEKVLRGNGRDERAYAATNPMEYFAESTEAFFGTNDFYPFVRAELRRHDPIMFELLRQLWAVSPAGVEKGSAGKSPGKTGMSQRSRA